MAFDILEIIILIILLVAKKSCKSGDTYEDIGQCKWHANRHVMGLIEYYIYFILDL